MRFPTEYYQMKQTTKHYMPHLRESQLKGLVLWVYGIILARSGCQNAVASELSFIGSFNSIRQYLREWLYDGQDRSNPCRVQLDVRLSFVPLLKWLLELWESDSLVLVHRPDDEGRPDKRHRHKRRLSKLRHSGRLAHSASQHARQVDGADSGHAWSTV